MKSIKHVPLITIGLVIAVFITLTIAGCGSKAASIVGTWSDENGSEILIFDEDGTCSVPFTYDGAWWESCDNYVVKDDGSLVLSSSKGNIRSRKYEKTGSRDDALAHSSLYYLSADELVINATDYEK